MKFKITEVGNEGIMYVSVQTITIAGAWEL